ncbi:MAG: hypothetical protein CL450_08885 [Acidimicrobiaceae bacterium]|nr:hypothetical protein [Acidimicrobiaceae bacterium]
MIAPPFVVIYPPLQTVLSLTAAGAHCKYHGGEKSSSSTNYNYYTGGRRGGSQRTPSKYKRQRDMISRAAYREDRTEFQIAAEPSWSYPMCGRKLVSTMQLHTPTNTLPMSTLTNAEIKQACRLYIYGMERGLFPELPPFHLRFGVLRRLQGMKATKELMAMVEQLDPKNKKFVRGSKVNILNKEEIRSGQVVRQRKDHVRIRYDCHEETISHSELERRLVRTGKIKAGTYVVRGFDSEESTWELWLGIVLCAHGENAYTVKWCGSVHDGSTHSDVLNKHAHMDDATTTYTTLEGADQVQFPPSQSTQWSLFSAAGLLSFPQHARIYKQRRAAGENNSRRLLTLRRNCPMGHDMTLVVHGDPNSYQCDCCNQQVGGGNCQNPPKRWVCHSCRYGICTTCWPHTKDSSSSGSGSGSSSSSSSSGSRSSRSSSDRSIVAIPPPLFVPMHVVAPVQCNRGTSGCHHNGTTHQHAGHCLAHNRKSLHCPTKISTIFFDLNQPLGLSIQNSIGGDLPEIITTHPHAQPVFRNLPPYTRIMSIQNTNVRDKNHVQDILGELKCREHKRRKQAAERSSSLQKQIARLARANEQLKKEAREAGESELQVASAMLVLSKRPLAHQDKDANKRRRKE